MIIKDGGHGITQKSLALWNARKKDIGKVTSVKSFFENIDETGHNTVITGEKGEMWLSGCNCGYGGEGPNGTREILVELGVDDETARTLMCRPAFIICFGDTTDF